MAKNKTVLVTGASGFVGGALARHLAGQGMTVRALVRDRAKAAYIDGVPGVELVDGDLGHELSLRKAVQGCAQVYHVAAALGGSPDHQTQVNVEGTRLLAAAAAQAGVQRFVHVSSIAIYGFGRSLPDVITEDTPPAPSNYAYTITKRAAEGVLRLIAAQTGMAYSIIRPGMIYGPRSNPWTVQMSALATRFPVIPFIGDGRGHIAAVHIDDVVSMCALAGEHPSAAGQAFNCAADPGVTWRDFLTAYAKHSGRSGRWLGIPTGLVRLFMPLVKLTAPAGSIVKDMPAVLDHHLRPVVYSNEKARRVLGWQPHWPIEDGLTDAAAWLASR
ncbi:MAG: NAD-dependent epimerase/dehydratase family protein [Anaerolineae bacterium]|jgi:nucleoside-diphosphate-sugar epimerase|nr:NAD-dependent epimerase/dehydratase family protein [Anaerolineae bacterium]